MTRCDETSMIASTATGSPATTTGGDPNPCDCEGCRSGDLPVNPFVALRVAYGMLLGEDDFRVLMGSPRGKQMLHSSWLHGSGVIWGYDVQRSGVWDLKVSAGLAVDGIGRELLQETSGCIDIRGLVTATEQKSQKDCSTRTIEACLVAQFDSCLSAPVPTLADPCDVTRKHDDYSRVIERVSLELRLGCCPRPWRAYHRVRVLLGLSCVGDDDPAGQEALEERRHAARAAPGERVQTFLCAFRRLAALDATDLHPASDTGDCYPTLFPVTEEDAAVVLAAVEIDVRDRDGCPEITDVRVDTTARTALLPTSTIQELTCGLAPGLITDGDDQGDAGGPRVIGEQIGLDNSGKRLIIPVTAPLARGSVQGAVTVSSLSPGRPGGWLDEDTYGTKFDRPRAAIVVRLDQAPRNRLIRVIVKGTGPQPVMGSDPVVPLAGLVGGPPATRYDGHDAVWIFENLPTRTATADDSDEADEVDVEVALVETEDEDEDEEDER